MSNVKLAIRVRPFTERERKSEKDCTPVVNVVDENTVTITNVKVSLSGAGDSRERVRRYFADYTFDSACAAADPSYASQEKVFESIGREVVTSVSSGAATCVLAYGQSATGKTHTMMGTDAQPGLVPRICQALAEELPIEISVSFLEIYNERVHDLLAGDAVVTCHSLPRRRGNSRKDLRVREHPTKGPYVQNLRRVAVQDLQTLLSLVAEGARRRQTAATKRNSTSSRSHALLELSTAKATLHLADLAGSEKASWEGCGGGRQKEGANINKSLVALSNVISALVSGGSRGRFVPYRDSALTWLLKDCFTGGARTFIITTVSPSVSCYGESASTLRWAARARQLPTQKIPTWSIQPSRAALQSLFNQLIRELANHFIRYVPETGKIVYDESHWGLSENTTFNNVVKTENKIGNIMNILNPSVDAPQSESTASSVASGSSDVINTMDKTIKSEVNKEVDKIFGAALERTKSDIEITAPLRHKRRQYKSQEVLPIDKSLQTHAVATNSESQTKIETNVTGENSKPVPNVPIFYDNNQRAEIVASVTERLYTKLKKKEEAAVSKIESTVDRKIMEPLSELRICTNARQRLMELSHKALRNKRRIGIPAHTQTRKYVIRVKNQGVDIQTDLERYIIRKDKYCTIQRDVATETVPMTPRCKEIAAGPKFGSLYVCNKATLTEHTPITLKNSSVMTDKIETSNRSTQTQIVPPPRRKRMSNVDRNIGSDDNKSESLTPFISINISQPYAVETDSQSSEDENNIQEGAHTIGSKPLNVLMTPDLLTNHNNVDTSGREEEESDRNSDTESKLSEILNLPNPNETASKAENVEFPDTEECCFPRVTVNTSMKGSQDEIKDIILGRNANLFPYNIALSPPRAKDNSKRIVKFKESKGAPCATLLTECNCENSDTSHKSTSSDMFSGADCVDSKIDNDLQESMLSDTTGLSKIETNSFIWNKGNEPLYKPKSTSSQNIKVGHKSRSRYQSNKTKMYREFLGLEPAVNKEDTDRELPSYYSLSDITKDTSSDCTDIEHSQKKFRQNRRFFEDKLNRSAIDRSEAFDRLERSILESCNSLDRSVNKYEDYLLRFRRNSGYVYNKPTARTPTQYMQHLVQLRREVVKRDCDSTDSSFK